jgi:hypothetical protein
VLMHALAASCKELRARTGKPLLDRENNKVGRIAAKRAMLILRVLSRAFFNIQAGGAFAPPVPPCAPPRNHILPPQEKSLFPKIIQTNQRRLTN